MKRTKYVSLVMLILFLGLVLAPLVRAEVHYEKLLVKADVLAQSLEGPNLRIVDCRRSIEEYQKGHIPGAVYLNTLKELRATGPWEVPGVRRMLEDQEELFGRTLGINNETMVILYDATGVDATRLLWELKYGGHDLVAILYGGWPEWKKQNLPLSTETPKITPQIFVGHVNPEILATAAYVLANLANPKVILVDCRPPEQFLGTKKHPQAAIGGHIPGAVNIFTETHWDNKTYLRDPEAIEGAFQDLGVSRDKTVVAYCNTGYFAANTWFILKVLGYPSVKMYDFSWTEWAKKSYFPKVLPSE